MTTKEKVKKKKPIRNEATNVSVRPKEAGAISLTPPRTHSAVFLRAHHREKVTIGGSVKE